MGDRLRNPLFRLHGEMAHDIRHGGSGFDPMGVPDETLQVRRVDPGTHIAQAWRLIRT